MKVTSPGANRTLLTLPSGVTVLFSYETPVAAFVPGEGFSKTEQSWSRTTAKHIGQWLRGEGLEPAAVATRPQAYFNSLAGGTD